MCIVIVENSNRQHFLTPVCNTIKWNYTTGINGFNWTNYGLRGKRLKIHAKLYKVFSLNNTWDLTKYLWENISQMVKQCSTVIPYTNTITWGFFLFVFLSRFLFRDLNSVYLGQDWAVCYIYTLISPHPKEDTPSSTQDQIQAFIKRKNYRFLFSPWTPFATCPGIAKYWNGKVTRSLSFP